jgi:TolA-binding protein
MDAYMTVVLHEEYAKRMEDEHKRQNKRIDKLEENQQQINDLTIAVKELALSVKSMVDEQKDHDERIEVLENRDGEKWRDVTKTLMTVIIGIVIGYIATQVGL